MTDKIRIFTPVAPEGARPSLRPSPFPPMAGAVLGVVENTKPNARKVLSSVAEQISVRHRCDRVVVERKTSAAEGIAEGAFQRLRAQQLALVIAGSGD